MPAPSPLDAALARHQPAVVEGLSASALAYALARRAHADPTLVICAEDERAERLACDLEAFGTGDVVLLLADEGVPFEDLAPDPALCAARLRLRQRLLRGDRPAAVVATVAAVQGRWMPAADFVAAQITVAVGQEVDRDVLARGLLACGYQPVTTAEDEGTFAVRGGVIDIFVPGTPRPLRVDLFGDEVAGLFTFEVDGQRPVARVAEATIAPIRDIIFGAESVARAQAFVRAQGEAHAIPSRVLRELGEAIGQQNYFYGIEALWPAFYGATEPVWPALLPSDGLLVLDGPDAVAAAVAARHARAVAERDQALARLRPAVAVAAHLTAPEEMAPLWAQPRRLEATPLALAPPSRPLPLRLGAPTALIDAIASRRSDASRGEILDPLVERLALARGRGGTVYLTCGGQGQAERLREMLLARRLDLPVWRGFAEGHWRDPRGQIAIVVAPVGQSVEDQARDVLVLAAADLFATAPPRRARRRRAQAARDRFTSLRALSAGALVIHQDHGIGRYLGLQRLVLGGVDGDYVQLEYAGGDKLYVPVTHLALLQPHRGPAEHARLDKLGGARWERTKQRVKDSVLAIAHELLALQAARKSRPGLPMPAPNGAYERFVAGFPYEETVDQKHAIDAVLADLQKDTPMDRLICGDVGFGKTEVALRGTYLAVLGGYQVAVLVPTTVLAEQHRLTFAERLGPTGAVVEALSRFRSAKETAEVLARVRRGEVDVLIGTHRLLSADVAFRRLGMLVVDEEQRFGVKHKERIKQLRADVHVLTLSATPIPRTLHMATTGMRDLSIIQTPPQQRTSVRTEVLRFDEGVMAEAIRRELHRGGQVFVVHNRVQTIEQIVTLVTQLVPEAKVAMAHGQMPAETLEQIMVGFVRRESDVLVCTAIIESGIDIPSANTMIVTRADTFGLSQLHQLRGRIGRGRERAYAYLMLPRGDALGREATDRLAVLKRFSDLGAGFQIASHDLEQRGAGDLLGADQSGNIAAVGFELYTELLAEASERLRGQPGHVAVEPDIKIPVSAVLPEKYVPEPMQRLAYYQRMAEADSDAAVFDVLTEIRTLYGETPPEVDALAEMMVIRRRLRLLGAVALSAAVVGQQLRAGLAFGPDAPVDRTDLLQRCQADAAHHRLLPSGRLAVTQDLASSAPSDLALLQAVRHLVGDLRLAGSRQAIGRGG